MKMIIKNPSGFNGTEEEFLSVLSTLMDIVLPVSKKIGTEYALSVSHGSVCIFRVDVNMEPKMIHGSMLAQISAGSLKIGFVDIHDEDIENSIHTTIREHWRLVREEVDMECPT